MKRFAVFLTLGLVGCAAVQPLVNPVDALLGEALAAARAPAPEQAAALARAQQAGVASPIERLRLATLLATLPAPLRDEARALELLEPIADASSSGTGRFAALLSSQIMERQRVVRELERISKEAANAARERERAEKARELLDKERDKREEALKQQLEALRAIERGILEREEKLRRRQK
jgi:RNA polymerase-interacting CarD/CdnL/TRCF family regulator